MPRDSVRVNAKGLDAAIEFVRSLSRMDDVDDRLDAALNVMSAEMTAAVPVRTGFTKSTARHESHVSGDEWVGTYTVGQGVPYLNFVFDPRQPNELDAIVNESEPLFRAALDGMWST